MLKIFSPTLVSETTMTIWAKQILRQSCLTLKDFYVFTSWIISHIISLFCHGHQGAPNEICGTTSKIQQFRIYNINQNNSRSFLLSTYYVVGIVLGLWDIAGTRFTYF